MSTLRHITAQAQKTATEKPREPAYILYEPLVPSAYSKSCAMCMIQHISHGKPRPKNTFTEFEPVTFTMEASAWESFMAAAREAKVSGREVPRATKVMAVTQSLRSHKQPNIAAMSAITAVSSPI
jgi:hypothetical protein